MRPSNKFIALAGLAAFVVSAFVSAGPASAQKQKGKPAPKAAAAAPAPKADAPSSPYSPNNGFMKFKSKVVQSRPDLIVVVLDLELWHGKKMRSMPGGEGVAVDVGVYVPEDKECRGDRIGTFLGKAREISGMDVPIKEQAVVTVAVPPSNEPYNVLVRLIGGATHGGAKGAISKNAAKALPELSPHVFSSSRQPAEKGF